MSPPPDSTEGIDERVRELCDRGLGKFRSGDVDGALLDWDRARLIDPRATAPNKYIQRVARGLDPGEDEVPSGIRMPLAPGEEAPEIDDEPEADEYEIELTAGEPDASDGPRESRAALESFHIAASAAFDDVDAGWSLDDEAAALPPPPNEHRAPSAGLGGFSEVPAAVMGVPDDAMQEPVEDELDLDLLPPVPTEAARADAKKGDSELELPPMDWHLAAARIGGAETLDFLPRPDLTDEYDDVPPTRELQRPPELQSEPEQRHDSDSDITVPGGGGQVPAAGELLSEDALRAIAAAGDGAPPEETTVERPGLVNRGFALPDLDELDLGARKDDRHEEETAGLRVTFREPTSPGMDDELTTERGAMSSGFGERSRTDSELTVERGPTRELRSDVGGDDELTVERPSPGAVAGSVAVERGERELSSAPDSGRDRDERWADVRDCIREQVSDTLSDRLQGDERVRHRVSAFIDRARLELDRDDTELAATALELALSEAPESAVAQKLIHRHRDLLIEIYEAYFGDTSAMPTLAVPMHELGGQELDSRAVFLLSRIDGTFTIEEIVDVSGMTTIEAYRHLARLLLQGILEVR